MAETWCSEGFGMKVLW